MSIRRYNAANKKKETSPKFSETSNVLLRAFDYKQVKKKSKSSYILDPFHPVYHQPNTNKLSQSLMSISILSLFQHQQESCMLHTSLLHSWSNNPSFIHSLSTLPPPSLLECVTFSSSVQLILASVRVSTVPIFLVRSITLGFSLIWILLIRVSKIRTNTNRRHTSLQQSSRD